MKTFYVYLMTNQNNTVIYTGVTSNLLRRISEHKSGQGHFTNRYQINKLVYFECCKDAAATIAREKQIKAGSRKNKESLITKSNPDWQDLFPKLLEM